MSNQVIYQTIRDYLQSGQNDPTGKTFVRQIDFVQFAQEMELRLNMDTIQCQSLKYWKDRLIPAKGVSFSDKEGEEKQIHSINVSSDNCLVGVDRDNKIIYIKLLDSDIQIAFPYDTNKTEFDIPGDKNSSV